MSEKIIWRESDDEYIARLLQMLDEKTNELAANAKMLARQCDLAREAETKCAQLKDQLKASTDPLTIREQQIYEFLHDDSNTKLEAKDAAE